MAERFCDPLFEKVGALTITGWAMWMEFFAMECNVQTEAQSRDKQVNDMVSYFESKGGHAI